MAGAIPVRRPAASGCARNVGQLSLDLLGAFAMGDVNRIAESFHWPRPAARTGASVMNAAAAPVATVARRRQLLAGTGAGVGGGAMQLIFSEPQQVLELGVERYSGCYFVRF